MTAPPAIQAAALDLDAMENIARKMKPMLPARVNRAASIVTSQSHPWAEISDAFHRQVESGEAGGAGDVCAVLNAFPALIAALRTARADLESAVAAERERCAGIAEARDDTFGGVVPTQSESQLCKSIAAAIRAQQEGDGT